MFYNQITNFAANAHLILTDSCGIQEKGFFFWCSSFRGTTERFEGITAGTLKLAGTNEDTIFNIANKLISDKNA